ncbi:hypothetical protein E2320_007069 [Naja naja]|nr:hypothetical protein E2320_007069 [Naja naja]
MSLIMRAKKHFPFSKTSKTKQNETKDIITMKPNKANRYFTCILLQKGFITTFSQIVGQYYTWFSPHLSWTADMIRWDRSFFDHMQYTCPTCTDGHGY